VPAGAPKSLPANVKSVPVSVGFQYERAELGPAVAKLAALVAEGKLRPSPVEVVAGGLKGIPEGLEKLKKGAVSGAKLVAELK